MPHIDSKPLSILEAEEFFSQGDQVWPPQARLNPANSDPASSSQACAFDDLPAIGPVHSPVCPRCFPAHRSEGRPGNPPVVIPGTSYVAGQIPEALANGLNVERQAKLFVQLLFAARRLADGNIREVVIDLPGRSLTSFTCCECLATSTGDTAAMRHRPTCRIDRVRSLIARILELPFPERPIRKETAPAEGERARAADGKLSRVEVPNHLCVRCGVRNTDWSSEAYPGYQPRVSALATNQLVSWVNVAGYILYTHRCAAAEGGAA